MKGLILLVLVCATGCLTVRAERFIKSGDAPSEAPAKVERTQPQAERVLQVEPKAVPEQKAVQKPEVVSGPPASAFIATRTEGSGDERPQLSRKGDWASLVWSNGFEIVVSTSDVETEDGVWYLVSTYQDGKLLETHKDLLDDPEAGDYQSLGDCDTLAPVVHAFDGPAVGIGAACYNGGGDNNYEADLVKIYRVDRPPTSLKDLTLLTRIKADFMAIGYYDNLRTNTMLELRGKEIWRTDVVTEGLSQEEQEEGVEREPVVTTTSELVISL